MARILVALGLVAVADALEGLALMRLKAERGAHVHDGAGSKGALPDVAELLPSKAFSVMKSKIDALEHRLTEVQQQDKAKIVKQKDEFEERLSERKRENRELEHANALIALRTRHMKESNADLRRRSHDVVSANDELRSELKALHANLTLAQEVLQQGLVAAENEAPEVQVLAELAELDAAASKNLEKQARLNEIGGSSSSLSLLEFSGHEHERAHSSRQPQDSPEVIMQLLVAHLEELSAEQNASEASLWEAFEVKLEHETQQHAVLLEEQARLNASSAEAWVLHQRLSAAFEHLSKTHKQLLARLKGVRNFAQRLGEATSVSSKRRHAKTAQQHSKVAEAGASARETKMPSGAASKIAAAKAGRHAARRHGGGRRSAQANASAAAPNGHRRGAVGSAAKKVRKTRGATASRRSQLHGRKHVGTRGNQTSSATDIPSNDDAAEKVAAETGRSKFASLFPKWLR